MKLSNRILLAADKVPFQEITSLRAWGWSTKVKKLEAVINHAKILEAAL